MCPRKISSVSVSDRVSLSHSGAEISGKAALDVFFSHELGPPSENSMRVIEWAADEVVYSARMAVQGQLPTKSEPTNFFRFRIAKLT